MKTIDLAAVINEILNVNTDFIGEVLARKDAVLRVLEKLQSWRNLFYSI
ncbi:MAG: hypothetical protein AB1847_23665 [bacterium]